MKVSIRTIDLPAADRSDSRNRADHQTTDDTMIGNPVQRPALVGATSTLGSVPTEIGRKSWHRLMTR